MALKIKGVVPSADHQANDNLLEFLGKSFRVPKQQARLKHGEHARCKCVEVVEPQARPENLLTQP